MPKKKSLPRSNKPPATSKPIHVKTVRSSERIQCVVLSKSLSGFWTHWNGSRTIPCYADQSKCQACAAALPRRWKGIIHVWFPQTGAVAFLELTPQSARSLLDQLEEKVPLRGSIIHVQRERASIRSPLQVILAGTFGEQDALPLEKDPEDTLRNIWGI